MGNAALLMTPQLHVLIDIGFLPKDLEKRMEGTGASWQTLDAVVLTHTHGDHVKKKCLLECADNEIPFWCHEHHAVQLGGGRYFKRLQKCGLVRTYDGKAPFEMTAPRKTATTHPILSPTGERENNNGEVRVRFYPIAVPHDSPPTFGFRIEVAREKQPAEAEVNVFGATAAEALEAYGTEWIKLGYLVDLGECSETVARAVADVDMLALEFNHDEDLQRGSGRHPRLIQRVMGKDGHLSNRKAAEVFRNILENRSTGALKLLLQMHLSQECNRPQLAYEAAQQVVFMTGAQTRVYSTRQDRRGTIHTL